MKDIEEEPFHSQVIGKVKYKMNTHKAKALVCHNMKFKETFVLECKYSYLLFN